LIGGSEASSKSVTKQRSNPKWGRPDLDTARNIAPTSFEEIVRELRLSPADYKHSLQLKEWVQKNKDQKYVPLDLLRAWDFEVT
jgi:hypothetical protein